MHSFDLVKTTQVCLLRLANCYGLMFHRSVVTSYMSLFGDSIRF